MIIPVILSGGAGTRLWPLSRELYPKQLLPLAGEETMLQATVTRLAGVAGLGAPLVVCNEDHRFMVAEQLRAIACPASAILLEPVGRNTAPAVAVAALQAQKGGDDPILLVLPADHVIRDPAALHGAIAAGAELAEAGHLVTFGIVPATPETGYGYIKAGPPLPPVTRHPSPVTASTAQTVTRHPSPVTAPAFTGYPSPVTAFKVCEFVEKPDLARAQGYVAAGNYFWNSGMFLFRASRFLEELQTFAPEILAACRQAMAAAVPDLDFVRLDAASFAASPKDSIDYAVMEKTAAAAVIPLDAGWSDVGSWSALWEIGAGDADGNVTFGDVLTCDVRNSYLYAQTRLVAAIGLDEHVVVETADAVLVAHKDRVQDVKTIVETLKKQKRPEALLHRRVNRPWGAYECIDAAERFQVKHITVHPGATLSLQMHHHRAEHWVVVRGTARITRGDEVLVLSENQSTYIPLGVAHRLENPGKIPLELIEVQSGSYLGEDDIVRFEDSYGRS
jgi:mannose-1-phosphate guanylyltransferase/mannose-6-phosphate isomerase